MTGQNSTEQGTISIHTDNIFPIIKKWLYSEKEIFLRELVSNAVDAIHKMQHVTLMESLLVADDYRIEIFLDKDKKTLTIKDNGIGMNADEIRRYINQIAFSSAEEFSRNSRIWKTKAKLLATLASVFTRPLWLQRRWRYAHSVIRRALSVHTGHATDRRAMSSLK